jgi:RecA-family ATPase
MTKTKPPTLFSIEPGLTAWLDTEPDNNNDWLVEKLMYRNTICMLDGLGASGKSYIALQLAIAIATGLPFLGVLPVEQAGRVLVLNSEDPDSISHARFRTICQNYIDTNSIGEEKLREASKNITYISMTSIDKSSILLDEKFMVTQTYIELAEFCKVWNPDLVILDPLSLFAAKENCNSYAAQFYAALRRLKSTILVVHHLNKSGMNGEGEDRSKSRGAGVYAENARTRIILRDNRLDVEKNNYYKKFSINLKFENGMWFARGYEKKDFHAGAGETITETQKEDEVNLVPTRGRKRRVKNYGL